jgi:hypothetical protein
MFHEYFTARFSYICCLALPELCAAQNRAHDRERVQQTAGRPAHDFFICTLLFACCALFLFLIAFSMDALIHIALLPFHPYLMTT